MALRRIISQRLVRFTRQKKEGKIMLLMCLLSQCYLTSVINGKIIEDEAIYNFGDFWLRTSSCWLPPGTYFNNKLLPSCRSSKFSPSFPATCSVLLCAPLDAIRPDRNSKSDGSVLIFVRQRLQ